MQSIWIRSIMTLFAKPDRKVLPPIWLAAALALVGFSARAQDYPRRPITMVVPFAAGGTSDVIARTVAEQMTVQLSRAGGFRAGLGVEVHHRHDPHVGRVR